MRSRFARPLLAAGSLVAGLTLAFWLAGYRPVLPLGQAAFRGFRQDAAGVRWTREYSKIQIPRTPWRPIRVELILQAPESAAEPIGVEFSVNDAEARTIAVGRAPLPLALTFGRQDAADIALQFRWPPGRDATVSVASIVVTPALTGLRPWWAAATGLLLAAVIWLAVASARRPSRNAVAAVVALALLAAGSGAAAFGPRGFALGAWGLASTFITEVAIAGLILMILTVPGWCVVDVLRSRRMLDPIPDAPALLSIPATMVLFGLIAMGLQMSGSGGTVFTVVAFALLAVSAGLLVVDRGRRTRAVEDLSRYRWCLILPAILATGAIFYLGVGLERFSDVSDWHRAASRYLHELPQDNELSWLVSETWRHHYRPGKLFSSIDGVASLSDRGPLFGLIHSFLARAFEPVGSTYANYTRLGIVLNSLFLGPLFLWLSAVLRERPARIATLLIALNPWVFVNVYYTWPKLLAASFLLAAPYLLWRRPAPSSTVTYGTVGVLAGLAALAHQGALLSMPLLWVVTLAGFTRSWKAAARSLMIPLMMAAVLLPWQLYKNRYAPDTYGLFYLHYLDAKEYNSPLGHNVGRFFAEHPVDEQIAVRTSNVRQLLWGSLEPALLWQFWRGDDVGARLHPPEFFAPWYSAGLLWLVTVFVAVPLALVLRLPALRRLRATGATPPRPGPPGVSVTAAAVFAIVSLTFNQALRWAPPRTHELPYMETVLLAACVLVVLARFGAFWLGLAGVVILARQVFYFDATAATSRLGLPLMDTFGILFWLTVTAGLLLVLRPSAPACRDALPFAKSLTM